MWNAEFNGKKIDDKQAKNWIKQGEDLLEQAQRSRRAVLATDGWPLLVEGPLLSKRLHEPSRTE